MKNQHRTTAKFARPKNNLASKSAKNLKEINVNKLKDMDLADKKRDQSPDGPEFDIPERTEQE